MGTAVRETADNLILARQAHETQDWATAVALFDAVGVEWLVADDLAAYADALWWLGRAEDNLRVQADVYDAYLADSRPAEAGWAAVLLGVFFMGQGDAPQAMGWIGRARRLLEGVSECPAHGLLIQVTEVEACLQAGRSTAAVDAARRMQALGLRVGDPGVVLLGVNCEGRALIKAGQVADGLALLDEAMACLTAGEVSPITAGSIYCAMVEGCQEVSEYHRMTEWTEALDRWCASQPDLVPYTGQCAVHRGQILRAHGSFAQALDELARAVERYRVEGNESAVGLAMYERGEVLRAVGDLDGAQAAYTEAQAYGLEPQPGLSLLWLARGRTSAAAASARRLLGERGSPVHRARLLPAVVQLLVAAGDGAAARDAARDLAGIADQFGCDGLQAQAGYAVGLAELAVDQPAAALGPLRQAWKTWINVGSRYDAARARVRIALAYRGLGDEESALSELAVAERTFADLGAEPARREAARLRSSGLPGGLTAREVEVLRLVARGRSNPQVATELVLSEKTVARHLSNIFTKTGVTSRTEAAAWAHEHDLA